MFLDSLDIANRACDHCGVDQILSPTEDSIRNQKIAAVYDKVRRAELQRNVWRFAIRESALRPMSTTALILVPATYSASSTYMQGEVVADTNGNLWLSQIADNINNAPGGNNNAWDAYFGPMSVDKYDATISYFAGELVYVITGATPNGYQIYMSMVSGNAAAPNVATAWSATVQYNQDQAVSYGGSQWRSLLPVNINNTPADAPLAWASGTTYSLNDTVTGSDSFIYTATGSTTGNNPVGDGGVHWTNSNTLAAWSRSPTLIASDIAWRPITATLRNPLLVYPLGSGPSSDSGTRNIYRLPAGYLKLAPQDPKAGSASVLGAPSNRLYDQWNFESNYIVAQRDALIRLRFVADVSRVVDMSDMFCEGLAARIAIGVCPSLTQSDGKLQTIASEYTKFMGEARAANFIETGAIEPPLDDYVACRV